MKIVIGADHRGFNLKYRLIKWFGEMNWEYEDVGALVYDEHDDYPIFATRVAQKVVENIGNMGVVICGSGVGVCVSANKVAGVRCGQAINVDQVMQMRRHDDVRVLSLAADYMSFESACEMIEIFVKTEFEGLEKQKRRLNQIENLEKSLN